MAHRDGYTAFVSSGVGKRLATTLGPAPAGGAAPAGARTPARRRAGARRWARRHPRVGGPAPRAHRRRATLVGEAPESGRLGGVVVDLTAVEEPADLESLRATLGPALKRLGRWARRVVVVGRDPAEADLARPARRPAGARGHHPLGGQGAAGRGHRQPRARRRRLRGRGRGTVAFLLSARSAYVDAQVFRVGAGRRGGCTDWDRPLDGKVAVVTGAARGIGAEIAATLARDGATRRLRRRARRRRRPGVRRQPDRRHGAAGRRHGNGCRATAILRHATTRHGGLDVVVHNAGITRDKLLANTDADRWASVVDVNLGSILRMNEAPARRRRPAPGRPRRLVSSIAGIAGNRGQSNYAASKAGVIGLVDATRAAAAPARHHDQRRGARLHRDRDDRRIPLATRELGRRLNILTPGWPAGRRRRDDRLVRLGRPARGQRQRRAGLWPEPARGLTWRSRPSPGCRPPHRCWCGRPSPPRCRGGARCPTARLVVADVRVDRGPARGLPAAGGSRRRRHAAANLPHGARLPGADGADGAARLPVGPARTGAPVQPGHHPPRLDAGEPSRCR